MEIQIRYVNTLEEVEYIHQETCRVKHGMAQMVCSGLTIFELPFQTSQFCNLGITQLKTT